MARLYDYVLRSQGLSRQRFATEFPTPFLCVRAEHAGENAQWSFKTETVSSFGYEMVEKLEERGLTLSPEIAKYEVFPVEKTPGNPWPERISVGRARNSDIVLPHSSVSKLHAHFVYNPEGKLTLVDAGSRNGTLVDKNRLVAGTPEPVEAGARITFGAITLNYLTPEELFELLERHVQPKTGTGG